MSYEEKLVRARRRKGVITEIGPLFDAADIARFGKNLKKLGRLWYDKNYWREKYHSGKE